MNAVAKTTPADAFRSKASGLLVDAANMTLHQLVDEFQRLTAVMDENVESPEDASTYARLNDAGELASRERRVITAASRARFGINFEAFDRNSPSESHW